MGGDRERIARSGRLLGAVRERYRGRGDVLDVLWWAEHPGEPTPAGLPDPSIALESERRSLYRQEGAADPGGVAARVAAHRADLDAAVAAARAVLAEPPAAHRVAVGRGGLAVLVAAAAAGGLLLGAVAAPGRPAPSASTQPTARALAVFTTRQRPAVDVPEAVADLPPFLDRRSIRRLHTYSSIGTVLYGARSEDEGVCIFAVVLAAPSTTACVSERSFAAGGLTLLIRATADPVDDSGHRPEEQLAVGWNPDRSVFITPFGDPTG